MVLSQYTILSYQPSHKSIPSTAGYINSRLNPILVWAWFLSTVREVGTTELERQGETFSPVYLLILSERNYFPVYIPVLSIISDVMEEFVNDCAVEPLLFSITV